MMGLIAGTTRWQHMLTEFMLRHPWLAPLTLGLVVAVGPTAGAWLVSQTRLAWSLCAISLVPVAVTTLWPVDRRLLAACTVQWSIPTPSRAELMANVVLFVAPVLLLAVATRRPLDVPGHHVGDSRLIGGSPPIAECRRRWL
jgi:hypothetical protein